MATGAGLPIWASRGEFVVRLLLPFRPQPPGSPTGQVPPVASLPPEDYHPYRWL